MILVWSVATAFAIGLAIIIVRRVIEHVQVGRAVRPTPARRSSDALELCLTLVPCEIDVLLHQAVGRAHARACRRTVRIVPGLTARSIMVGDHRRLLHVLAKLIDRGVDLAQPGDEIMVCASKCAGDVRFTIEDANSGLLPEQITRLFDRPRADADHPPDNLYDCRRVVEAHGGRIGVFSAVGEGTTLWFTIPTEPTALR